MQRRIGAGSFGRLDFHAMSVSPDHANLMLGTPGCRSHAEARLSESGIDSTIELAEVSCAHEHGVTGSRHAGLKTDLEARQHQREQRPGERHQALRDRMTELMGMDEPRRRTAGMLSGLDIHYDLGVGHPLLGRRMPDLDVQTAHGPTRVFALLHDARPVLLNLGEPGDVDITPWAERVHLVDAKYEGAWVLPALGLVSAPTAVLIRPDGYVAWVGELTQLGLHDALTTWFGRPAAA